MVTYGVDPPNFVDFNEREREKERDGIWAFICPILKIKNKK